MKRQLLFSLVPAMYGLVFTSCPGEDCESEHTPEGCVVKMEKIILITL